MDFVRAALDDGKTLLEESRDDKQTNCFQTWLNKYFTHILRDQGNPLKMWLL